jgi:hypothetical protein
MQHGYPKTQNLIIILNLFKKLQKNTGQKKLLTKKLKKNGVFNFYCCVQNFSACKFVELIAFFSTVSNSAWDFAFYDTPIWSGRLHFVKKVKIVVA